MAAPTGSRAPTRFVCHCRLATTDVRWWRCWAQSVRTKARVVWVLTEEEWRSDERMLDRIVSLLDPMERNAYDRAAAHARAAPQATLAAMTDATLAVYRDAQKRASPQPAAKPIAAERCLAALHYAPWRPPSTTVAAPD